jgi:hypothetical protein
VVGQSNSDWLTSLSGWSGSGISSPNFLVVMIPLSLQNPFFSFEFTLSKKKPGKSLKTSNNSNPFLEVRNIRKLRTFLASKVLTEHHSMKACEDWKHSSTVLNLSSRWRRTFSFIPPLLFRQRNEVSVSFKHEAAWATDREKGMPCPCRAVSKQKWRTCVGPLLHKRKQDISQACC